MNSVLWFIRCETRKTGLMSSNHLAIGVYGPNMDIQPSSSMIICRFISFSISFNRPHHIDFKRLLKFIGGEPFLILSTKSVFAFALDSSLIGVNIKLSCRGLGHVHLGVIIHHSVLVLLILIFNSTVIFKAFLGGSIDIQNILFHVEQLIFHLWCEHRIFHDQLQISHVLHQTL